ncbi:MAG: hypothetical protein ACK559_14820 [bacterium]
MVDVGLGPRDCGSHRSKHAHSVGHLDADLAAEQAFRSLRPDH